MLTIIHSLVHTSTEEYDLLCKVKLVRNTDVRE